MARSSAAAAATPPDRWADDEVDSRPDCIVPWLSVQRERERLPSAIAKRDKPQTRRTVSPSHRPPRPSNNQSVEKEEVVVGGNGREEEEEEVSICGGRVFVGSGKKVLWEIYLVINCSSVRCPPAVIPPLTFVD